MKNLLQNKKLLAIIAIVLVVAIVAIVLLTRPKTEKIKIGVPSDTTNEARALQLLADNGIIKLKDGAGEMATKADVISEDVEIVEVAAEQLVNHLNTLDYAVINSNFVLDALDAGIKVNKSLVVESKEKYLPRANVIAVKGENKDAPLTKALIAAAKSQKVKDYIEATYAGAVISVVDDPTDGYDPDVDYEALAGQKILVAATAAPHAQILKVMQEILAAKDITLEIKVFSGYTEENPAVNNGEAYANYFQHQQYLDEYVKETGGDVVSVVSVHTEPMGLYGGKQENLDAVKKSK